MRPVHATPRLSRVHHVAEPRTGQRAVRTEVGSAVQGNKLQGRDVVVGSASLRWRVCGSKQRATLGLADNGAAGGPTVCFGTEAWWRDSAALLSWARLSGTPALTFNPVLGAALARVVPFIRKAAGLSTAQGGIATAGATTGATESAARALWLHSQPGHGLSTLLKQVARTVEHACPQVVAVYVSGEAVGGRSSLLDPVVEHLAQRHLLHPTVDLEEHAAPHAPHTTGPRLGPCGTQRALAQVDLVQAALRRNRLKLLLIVDDAEALWSLPAADTHAALSTLWAVGEPGSAVHPIVASCSPFAPLLFNNTATHVVKAACVLPAVAVAGPVSPRGVGALFPGTAGGSNKWPPQGGVARSAALPTSARAAHQGPQDKGPKWQWLFAARPREWTDDAHVVVASASAGALQATVDPVVDSVLIAGPNPERQLATQRAAHSQGLDATLGAVMAWFDRITSKSSLTWVAAVLHRRLAAALLKKNHALMDALKTERVAPFPSAEVATPGAGAAPGGGAPVPVLQGLTPQEVRRVWFQTLKHVAPAWLQLWMQCKDKRVLFEAMHRLLAVELAGLADHGLIVLDWTCTDKEPRRGEGAPTSGAGVPTPAVWPVSMVCLSICELKFQG